MLHYLRKTQMCVICGKVFTSTPKDKRGEILYEHHWNLSKNVKKMFESKRSDDIVNQFFKIVGDNKANMMELLECMSRYDCEDKELLVDVRMKIQERIKEIE